MMNGPLGQDPSSFAVELTSATLPADALKGMVPLTSGGGRSSPQGLPPQPAAPSSAIRRYCPGAIVTSGSTVTCHVAPEAEAYCTDQPPSLTGLASRLKSSMK